MKNQNLKKIKGYIEGYYGKLLTWNDRKRLIDTLAANKMNFYFYCPKEDINHRFLWRESYKNDWLDEFQEFNNYAKTKKVKVIAGISPGLDFNYKKFLKGKKNDLNLLKQKIQDFLSINVQNIAIMFDDIAASFDSEFTLQNEGSVHAKIINEIYANFDIAMFSVPRIYSDELIFENPHYIKKFFKEINNNIFIFYCGKYVVSESFKSNTYEIKDKIKKDKIVYWDNFYANDYCPKKMFIGPWKNKFLTEKSMINGTGMIETDLIIIEIVNKTCLKKNKYKIWKDILIQNRVPKEFFRICKPFLSPNFTYETKSKNIKINNKFYKNLDHLLWKWKNVLSREWYPFILNFKQDLQILDNSVSLNRILKTQTNPLHCFLTKRRNIK